MELPEMGTWKNGNESGRSHSRFVFNGQKSGCKIHEAAFKVIDPSTLCSRRAHYDSATIKCMLLSPKQLTK